MVAITKSRSVILIPIVMVLAVVVRLSCLEDGSNVVVQRQIHVQEPAATPLSSPAAHPAETASSPEVRSEEPKFLLRWKQVPHWISSCQPFPPISSRIVAERSITWEDVVEQIRWNGKFQGNEASLDLELRAAGLVSALDNAILQKCGFVFKSLNQKPEQYFPLFCQPLAEKTPNPDSLFRDLSALVQAPDSILDQLPESIRPPDILEGVRSRAILLLGRSPLTQELRALVASQMMTSDSPSVQVAAAMALINQGDSEAKAWIISTLQSKEPERLLSAMASQKLHGVAVSNERVAFTFWAPVNRTGREFDSHILALATQASQGSAMKMEATRALVGRSDNQDVREYLLGTLSATSDPQIASTILEGGRGLAGDARFEQGIQRWIHSDHQGASLWAMYNAAFIPRMTLGDQAVRHLLHDDPRWVHAAVGYLVNHGPGNPELIEQVTPRFMEKWKNDMLLMTYFAAARNRADKLKRRPESYAREVKQAVRDGFWVIK